MRVYEKPMIKVDANVEDDKVVLTSEGPLSTIAKPILKRINRIFQEEKPITFNDEEDHIFDMGPPDSQQCIQQDDQFPDCRHHEKTCA